jgi:tetratricopeptide (TPR) repeat protein
LIIFVSTTNHISDMRKIVILCCLVFVAAPLELRAQWSEVKRLVQESDKGGPKADSLMNAAYRLARISVARDPNNSDEHLWMANAAGRLAQSKSGREKIELSKVVKSHAEQAIKLDPKNAAAHMTLGAWHFYVADLSWIEKNLARMLYEKLPDASYERAVEELTLAINYNVEFIIETYYIRALAYEALDQDAKARADYQKILTLKPRNAKDRNFQKEARDWLD